MGEDTETMSHFTLPANTVSETITFTAPNPDDQNQLPLTVHMHFDSDSTAVLRMTGYGVNSNFSDGLEITDNSRALTTLTLKLAHDWPDSDTWSITVDVDNNTTVLSSRNPEYVYTLQQDRSESVISLTITHTLRDKSKLITGDPKIKVIRPTG